MIRYHGSSSASFFTGSRDFYTFRARVERTIYACIFSLSLFQSFPNRFSDFSLKKYYGGKKHTIKKYYDQLNLTIISHTRYLHDLLLQTFPFFFEKYNSQLLLKLNIKFLEKERRKKKPHLRHFPTPIIFLVSFAIRCKEKKRKKKMKRVPKIYLIPEISTQVQSQRTTTTTTRIIVASECVRGMPCSTTT